MTRAALRRFTPLVFLAGAIAPLHLVMAASGFQPGVQTGTIQNPLVTEASGIVASRANANVLWTHNDSGHPAELFAMTPAGTNLGKYTVTGIGNNDWEDIAIGAGPTAGVQYLYIGDIGDNAGPGDTPTRASIGVFRVPEPAVSANQSPIDTSIAGAVKFTLVYPDGARDAESLFVDPLTRDVYIITKRDTPTKRVYRAAYPQATSGTTTLEFVTEFTAASTFLTAADISLDGNEIIVRSTGVSSGRMYVRPLGGTIADAFATTPFPIPLVTEAQGEAIGFDAQSSGYFTTSEGLNAPIHYFARVPEPTTGAAVAIAFAGLLARRRARRDP